MEKRILSDARGENSPLFDLATRSRRIRSPLVGLESDSDAAAGRTERGAGNVRGIGAGSPERDRPHSSSPASFILAAPRHSREGKKLAESDTRPQPTMATRAAKRIEASSDAASQCRATAIGQPECRSSPSRRGMPRERGGGRPGSAVFGQIGLEELSDLRIGVAGYLVVGTDRDVAVLLEAIGLDR